MDGTKLTGLWKNESKNGESYLSGSLGMARLLVFPNGHKDKDSDPDYVAYLVPSKKKEDKRDPEKPSPAGWP